VQLEAEFLDEGDMKRELHRSRYVAAKKAQYFG
jgi:hypothetical protein